MLSFLYVYSDHSILECYNLFSGIELSMRSFFVISRETRKISFIPKTENLQLKTLEVSLRHYDQTPRFSNTVFSILHYTQNGKLGVENLEVFSEVYRNIDIFYEIV